jgi:hypothetical protein
MKNIFRILTVMIVGLAFSAALYGQSSATANASATIIGPIAIANTADMNFGNVAVGSSGGTVVLSPAGGRSVTGGVTLPATAGTVGAAAFNVTGVDTYTFAITLPASVVISSGGNNMTVDNFTSTPSGTGTIGATGTALTVGATLNVNASQPSGNYTSATPFTVTVNYN